ncbi:DKNYY domain-containing protein [Flavobacterium gelatinilyticum]|uniref:DKNYY domain-containing protein n=1 Tax=Flavobacterium gelatinilyticum TaxID=3003260 RepID=UPI00247FF88E|nr:DKNYY domain-containing protein [Flavobacterium gelatinilyticum]
MYKSVLFFIILLLISHVSFAQNEGFYEIKDPIVDTSLTLQPSLYNETLYIKTKNYVIFLQGRNQVKLKADMKSFRIPYPNYEGAFALDKKGIYYKGRLIKTDTTGFKIISSLYTTNYGEEREVIWKTKHKLFRNNIEIEGDFDLETFTAAGASSQNSYFKDKNCIYYDFKKIEGLDMASVSTPIQINAIYDKNYVYIDGKIGLYKGDTLRSVNAVLMKTSKEVLTLEFPKVIPFMDAASIKPLSLFYSMDKNFVYYYQAKTPVLPADFKNVKVWGNSMGAFLTDGIRIFSGVELYGSDYDAETFGVLPDKPFVYDKNGIYWFKLNEKEHKRVKTKIPFSYDQNFTLENLSYNSKSRFLICKNEAFDPSAQKVFKNLTAAQLDRAAKNNLDFKQVNGELTEAVVFDYMLYKANNKIYCNDKETSADAAAFERISNFYKDKNHLYYYDRDFYQREKLLTIKGIDAQTVTNFHGFLADKDYIYNKKYRLIKSKDAVLLDSFAGYRPGCGMDTTPISDYFLFKNSEGYWLVLLSDTAKIKYLGNNLSKGLGFKLNNEFIDTDSYIHNTYSLEEKPEYPGGSEKLEKFVQKKFKAPKDEGEKLKGKVYLTFVIEKNGELTNIKILRDYGYGSGKEAIRVMKLMPKWKPAKDKGKLVRCLYTYTMRIGF